MVGAYIRNKGKKRYVVVNCPRCGRTNVFKPEHFIMAYVNGRSLFCKYCGAEWDVTLDNKLEKEVLKWKSRRALRKQ